MCRSRRKYTYRGIYNQCLHTLALWSELHVSRNTTGFNPSTLIRNALTDYSKESHRLAVTYHIPFPHRLISVITEVASHQRCSIIILQLCQKRDPDTGVFLCILRNYRTPPDDCFCHYITPLYNLSIIVIKATKRHYYSM